MIALRLQHGVEHLVEPALPAVDLVVLQTDIRRVLLRDVCGTEEPVLDEEHVAAVALVVTDTIGNRQRMVRPVRARCRDRALHRPNERAQRANAVQRLVPAPGTVRTHDDVDTHRECLLAEGPPQGCDQVHRRLWLCIPAHITPYEAPA